MNTLSQHIISVLSVAYPTMTTEAQASGCIYHQLDDTTSIHIHGIQHIQKGKVYFFVQVRKDLGNDLGKSRGFYIEETNPASIKPKLKFLLTKKNF